MSLSAAYIFKDRPWETGEMGCTASRVSSNEESEIWTGLSHGFTRQGLLQL